MTNDHDPGDDDPNGRERPPVGDGGATPEGGEPTGLAGVDAEPLPPPTREAVEALRRENVVKRAVG